MTMPAADQERSVSGAGAIIDQRHMGPFQIRTVTLCGMVLFMDGFDANTIGFLAPSIAKTTHIPIATFGPIFSSSLVGLMIAAMLTGPLADRWGRKWPVILSTITLAVFSVLTAHATTFNQLLIFRFLTGLGLGGALPNSVALAAEYMPKRLLSVLVAVLFCGVPLGGFICGLMSSAMVPIWGWQSVFYVGGALPLAISLLLILILPESVQFLILRRPDSPRLAKLLARIAPDAATTPVKPLLEEKTPGREGMPVKQLFTEGRALGTLLLWVPNFMNLLLMYFIINWLPALLTSAGMSVSAGVTASAFFSCGGILGSLVQGALIARFGAYKMLLAEFGLASILVVLMSSISPWFPLVIAVTFALGFFVIGAQAGLNVLAARFYPTAVRSTGVGWALGIGRIGSIVGPLLPGILWSAGAAPRQVLLSGAVAALCAWLSILLSNRVRRAPTPFTAEA